MNRGFLWFSSLLGVTLLVAIIVALPLLVITSIEGQYLYFRLLFSVALYFHVSRFIDWLVKDKENKK